MKRSHSDFCKQDTQQHFTQRRCIGFIRACLSAQGKNHSPKFNYLYWLWVDKKAQPVCNAESCPTDTHKTRIKYSILFNKVSVHTHQVPLISELGIKRFDVDVPLFPPFGHLLLCPSHLNKKCTNTEIHVQKLAKQTKRWRDAQQRKMFQLQRALLTVIEKWKKTEQEITMELDMRVTVSNEFNRDPNSQRDDSRHSEIRGTGVLRTLR